MFSLTKIDCLEIMFFFLLGFSSKARSFGGLSKIKTSVFLA